MWSPLCAERPQFFRGGSASTETMLAVSSLPFHARLFLSLGTTLMLGSTAAVEPDSSCSKHLLRGVVEVALDCAHRTSTF